MGLMVMGLGATCAGVSWLHQMLGGFDDIQFPLGKKSHFWDKENDDRKKQHLRLYPRISPYKIADISGNYALLSPERIAQIAGLYRHLRVIYILRHPVARSCDHIGHHIARLPLHPQNVPLDLFWALMRCDRYLAHNDYAANYARWAEYVDPESMLLIAFDDIVRKPRRVIQQLADFLNSDPYYHTQLTRAQIMIQQDKDIVPKAVKDEMMMLYAPSVENMNKLIGREVEML